MAFVNAAVVFLTVLFCNCQVKSNLVVLSNKYSFSLNHQVKIGRNHIDKEKCSYAACIISYNKQTARCDVVLDNNPFDESEEALSCPVTLATRYERGKLEIVGVELLGEEKVIFVWQDLNSNSLDNVATTIQEMHMPSCQSNNRQLLVDNRDDTKHQIFIIPVLNSYIISFRNRNRCSEYFCKLTVHEDGSVTEQLDWFSSAASVTALDSLNDEADMFMLTTKEYGLHIYRFLRGSKPIEVARIENIDPFGWSASNGVISLCDKNQCKYVTNTGKKTLTFKLKVTPYKYANFYNLPYRRGHLALICDSEAEEFYHIIKIDQDGKQEFFYELTDLVCLYNHVITSKFYMNDNGKFCLSLFQSQYGNLDTYFFKNYCFYA